jgi:hypothetical protein
MYTDGATDWECMDDRLKRAVYCFLKNLGLEEREFKFRDFEGTAPPSVPQSAPPSVPPSVPQGRQNLFESAEDGERGSVSQAPSTDLFGGDE